MRKTVLLLLLATTLSAQTAPTADSPDREAPPSDTPSDTGISAIASAQAAQDSEWKGWVFAGTALLVAAIGVTIVSYGDGQPVQH